MKYNYSQYNKKQNNYMQGFTTRFAITAFIFLLLVALKITSSYNNNNYIEKLSTYYSKDRTNSILTFISSKKSLSTFSFNKIITLNKKQNFNIEFLPVDGEITKQFGEYIDNNTNKKMFNNGVDISIKDSNEVKCIYDGTIEKVENNKENNIIVTVSHKDGYTSIYYNLSELKRDIGEEIKKGEVLGLVDKEKVKLIHFEVKKNNEYVDPLSLKTSTQ